MIKLIRTLDPYHASNSTEPTTMWSDTSQAFNAHPRHEARARIHALSITQADCTLSLIPTQDLSPRRGVGSMHIARSLYA